MAHEQKQPPANPEVSYGGRSATQNERHGYGIALVLGSVVMVAFMAMHPRSHAHGVEEFAAEMSHGLPLNALVHGSLIAVMGVLLLGMTGLVEALGLHSMIARGGLIAYAAGIAAGSAAALVNGFVVPAIAAAHAGGEAASLEMLRAILMLCHFINNICARVDVVAVSAATVLWSLYLVHRSGAWRSTGIVGMVCGLIPLIAIASGHLAMDLHGFGLFILLQGVFGVAAGIQLLRERLPVSEA